MQEMLAEILQKAFQVDSIWSIVLRGLIWFAVATVIIISADVVDPDKTGRNIKSNLGFFLMFLVLTGGLIYLLFGFGGQMSTSV